MCLKKKSLKNYIPRDFRTSVKLGSILEFYIHVSHIIIIICMVFDSFVPRVSQEILSVALKKVHHLFRSLNHTPSFTIIKNQEVQQSTVLVAEFNNLKDELRGLTQMITRMIRRLNSNTSQPTIHDSDSGSSFFQPENLHPQGQNIPNPFDQLHIPQLIPFKSMSRNLSKKRRYQESLLNKRRIR